MRLLAELVMRGRSSAVVVVSVAALLSLLMPPLSYVSGGALALVTLRVGPRQGLTVALGAAVAVGLLALLLFGTPLFAAVFLAGLWLPVGVLAVRLRRTASLPRTMALGGWFGAALVIGFYLVVGDPAGWWRETLRSLLTQTGEAAADVDGVLGALEPALALMTGAAAAAFVMSLVGSLFVGRWWQALLYNPGGFRQEFHALRLGRGAGMLALLLVALNLLGGTVGQLAAELVMVAGLLFALQGLAVVHGLVGRTGAATGWLVGTYVLLLLALPQMALTLAVTGLADNWFDFRTQFGGKTDS